MGRVVKWTLLLPTLLLALAAGAAALLLTVQQERLRDYAAGWLSAALGRSLRLDGELQLALWPVPRLRLEDVRLANTPWGRADWLLELAALELRPALAEGRVLVRELRLLRPVLNLEVSGSGERNWTLPARAPGTGSGPAPELARVTIIDGLIRYRARDGALLTARLNGAVLSPLTAPDPDLEIALEGPGGADLEPLLGRALPALPAFAVAGRLGRQDSVWSLDELQARLGDSDLAGRLALDSGGPRPRLTAELRSETLDLAALAGSGPAPEAGDGWFDPQALTGVDAEIDLTGTAVAAPGLRLEGLRLRLVLDNGRLGLEPGPAEHRDGPLRAIDP